MPVSFFCQEKNITGSVSMKNREKWKSIKKGVDWKGG